MRSAKTILYAACLALCCLPTAAQQSAGAPAVSFARDVMPVLSKAGCNAGVCHGNKNGKGGFRLSLRGEDPQFDFHALSRAQFGRRIDLAAPEASLLLQKPTLARSHEGGRRFTRDSLEFRLLRDWIAAGLPNDLDSSPKLLRLTVTPQEQLIHAPERQVQLAVRAEFADGPRDVTALAAYDSTQVWATVSAEGLVTASDPRDPAGPPPTGEATILVRFLDRQTPVRLAFVPQRPNFTWKAPAEQNYIDAHVFARLRQLKINPSPLCDDVVFVRRAYLDLLGVIPTAAEARRFIADAAADKRRRLVDALLERPEFAEHFALKLSDLLKNEERTLDRKGVQNFHQFLKQSIDQGKPWNELARELVAGRGSTYTEAASNWLRANREPAERAEATALVFLGTRLQCAKCHNHPFERWSQDDYYRFAAIFASVQYKILENNRRDRNDPHEFDGEQIVWSGGAGQVIHPRTGRPAGPALLDGRRLAPDDPLQELADWLASPENRLFASVSVNRFWSYLLGRGIVEPVDDFRSTNPPSHPALLEALAEDFIAHGYDVRHLLRTIMLSSTYQLDSAPNDTNGSDETLFSRAYVRRLSAEQLLDSASQFMQRPVRFAGYPLGMRAGQIPGVTAVRERGGPPTLADRFLKQFGKPPRLLACDCERTAETTLNQTFELIGGPLLSELLTAKDNFLGQLLSAGEPLEAILEDLYFAALSRAPTAEERQRLTDYLAQAGDRRKALEDVAWALVNSKEFWFRR